MPTARYIALGLLAVLFVLAQFRVPEEDRGQVFTTMCRTMSLLVAAAWTAPGVGPGQIPQLLHDLTAALGQ